MAVAKKVISFYLCTFRGIFFSQNITFSRLVLKIIFEFFPFKSISQKTSNNSKFVILILKNTKNTLFHLMHLQHLSKGEVTFTSKQKGILFKIMPNINGESNFQYRAFKSSFNQISPFKKQTLELGFHNSYRTIFIASIYDVPYQKS